MPQCCQRLTQYIRNHPFVIWSEQIYLKIFCSLHWRLLCNMLAYLRHCYLAFHEILFTQGPGSQHGLPARPLTTLHSFVFFLERYIFFCRRDSGTFREMSLLGRMPDYRSTCSRTSVFKLKPWAGGAARAGPGCWGPEGWGGRGSAAETELKGCPQLIPSSSFS